MLGSYLKIALKVLSRRRFFTAVSLGGIGFTLMVLLVVAALVDHVLSPQAPEVHLDRTLFLDRIIASGGTADGEVSAGWQWWSEPGYGFLDRYQRDIPGVEKMAIATVGHTVVSFVNGEKLELTLRLTDGAYWEILHFEFLEGGPITADDDAAGRFVTVISDAMRRQFFGEASALNQTLEVSGQRFRVVGVVATVPETRRSAAADLWAPHCAAKDPAHRQQNMGDCCALFLAASPADFPRIIAEFKTRLPHVEFPEHDDFESLSGTPLDRFDQFLLGVGGLRDDGSLAKRESWATILLMLVAFLLLPIINLVVVNLSRIYERASEIGVRKAFGASSANLVGQFIFENIFLCFLGSLLALAGTALVLGVINWSDRLPNAHLQVNFTVFLCALGFASFLGLVSGAFPAWRMSRLHPVEALKGGR